MTRVSVKLLAVVTIFMTGVTSCNTTKQTEKTKSVKREEQALQEDAIENIPSDNSNKEPVQKASEARSILIGKWEWEKTICCGRKPEIMKPEDDKKTQFLEFKKDSTVLFYKGDEIEKRKKYKVNGGTLVNNVPEIDIEGQQPGILRIAGDELVLDYSYIDLQTEYYRKVK